VELLVGAVILTSVLSERGDLNQLIISRLFAISFLLIDLIAWIIPHRVATFQRTGKSHAWVSLTLAAWLAVLTLIVLMALPSNWPWELVG
jgi:Kef-type K+ transport system membrane component KefB